MEALRIAISLLKVPKLFATLFLFPLLLSLLLVAGQLFITATFLRASDSSSRGLEERYQARKDFNIARKLLYGDAKPLPPIRVCRWKTTLLPNGKKREDLPSPECTPKRLDVAILVPNVADFDTSEYEKIFDGNVETLHVCVTCRPDVVIHPVDGVSGQMRADALSVWGLVVLHLIKFDGTIQEQYLHVAKSAGKIQELLGDIYFNAWGLKGAARLSGSEKTLAVIFNVASLTMIALWLAIKAHRRILDYFSRNGALLPMVAAAGKGTFYRSLWLLTLFRVSGFLLAAVPATLFVFIKLFEEGDPSEVLSGMTILDCALWLAAIAASFSMATIIASVADLKRRHHFMSTLYTFAPLLLSTAGAALWAATFLVDGATLGYFRNFITALPVVGMAPTILAPNLRPLSGALVTQAILSVVGISYLVRRNARWFAAHLEEL